MVEYVLGKSKRSPDRCMYPSKPCQKKRAYKLNGQLHKLCEEHRQQANRNQKRLQQRRKMKQLHELQVYVLDTFAQGPEPDDEAYDAFAYGGKVEPQMFTARNNPSDVYDPHLHFFPDDDTTNSDSSSMLDWDSLAPLRLDEDESARALTAEDIYILRALLLDP